MHGQGGWELMAEGAMRAQSFLPYIICRHLRRAWTFPIGPGLGFTPVLSRSQRDTATPADIKTIFQVRFIESHDGRND